MSPPLWRAIGWVQRGPAPPVPSLWVPLKWAKAPRSSGVRSLSLGAEMGSKGGHAGRAGMRAGGRRKGIQIRYRPQIWEDVSYWSQIPQLCRLRLGAWGCRWKVWRERGVPSPPRLCFGVQEQEGTLPQPQAQAALSLRSWMSQHSCRPGPLPPSVPKLSPRLRRPGPSPTCWRGPGGACWGGPCAWGVGVACLS